MTELTPAEQATVDRFGIFDDPYTPTTAEMLDLALFGARAAVRELGDDLDEAEFLAQWDRWLAAHDAEVAAKALREAVSEMNDYLLTERGVVFSDELAWLERYSRLPKESSDDLL